MIHSATGVQFDQHHFVLGMEWRLLPPAEKIVRHTIDQLRKEGMRWYAASTVQDIVGICDTIPNARQTMHSAALHLATQWSNGGLELFVFGVPQQRVAVVALNDRRPIPGYDFVGTMSEARALIDEFESIQRGQTIRRVGDLGLLADEEKLSAHTVFDEPRSTSRLRKIDTQQWLPYALAAALLVCGLGGAYYVLAGQPSQEILDSQPPPDPNWSYNQQVNQHLEKLDAQGQAQYTAWTRLLSQLPLTHQGWVLSQVECQTGNCSANWKRQFGSVDDFYTRSPLQTTNIQTLETEKDLLAQQLQTRFDTPALAAGATYKNAADLPANQQGSRRIASWLQDLSLVGAEKVQLENAQIWMGPADASMLKSPVYKGTWSVELPLGLATDLEVPPFATVTSLKASTDKHYQLSGDYYVRAN
jgi:hypothetical protein